MERLRSRSNIKMKKLITLLPLIIMACNGKKTEAPKTVTTKTTENAITKAPDAGEIFYTPYKADSIKYDSIPHFYKNSSYKLGNRILVEGSYEATDGNFTPPDTKDDNGHRLMLFDLNKKLLYKSQGQGDVYVYEPNFFTNKVNNNVLVFARLGYEYNFGGDLYLIKNGTIKFLGNLDIEPNTEEKSLVDVMKISQKDEQYKITFDYDSLVVNPAGAYPKAFKNNGTHYIYHGKKLKFYKK